MSEDSTMKPSIDPDSSINPLLLTIRRNEMKKRIPKYGGKDYAKMYRTMKKFRDKQRILLGIYDGDPDPFSPSYVFYCFTGKLEE